MAELKLISYDDTNKTIKQPTSSDYSSSDGDLIVGAISFDDVLMAELSIPGVQLQTDTNAFTFTCPYNLELTGVQLILDNHGTSGNVTVTIAIVGGSTINTTSITGTNSFATSSFTSTRSAGDDIRFAITATPSTNTNGLRANLLLRRTIA